MGKKQKKNPVVSEDEKEEKKPKEKKPKNKKGKKTPEVKDVTPVVKVVDKKAIVDQYFPDRNSYHIYDDNQNYFNGKYFSCTLNKSDVDKNNNKFYIIQLLENEKDNFIRDILLNPPIINKSFVIILKELYPNSERKSILLIFFLLIKS